ncbi:MmgE/PrpD family protein [Streptomyces sp. NPDC052101]|uniref:MmgE/PrpD family protein n=1 Tax=Streptomyces sp. NPDC052101 TaxID=3155763 RepID=UPI00342ED1AB
MLKGNAPRGLIDDVADFAERAVKTGLADRRENAVRAVLDTVGNMALGAAQPIHGLVSEVARQWGTGDAATAIGHPHRMPSTAAAFVNGTLAHCMDFDDTHLPSVLHPSASVVPAAFAAGEAGEADGPRLLDAITVGIEVCVRLGMAGYDAQLGNSIFFERGQHATAICGAVGSAVAAAMLATGGAGTIAAAASIAASMGSGLLEANRTGGSVKRIHTGWAAHCGVAAAQLAACGLTGPPTVLEGRFGFFTAFCGEGARPELVTEDLGDHWYSDAMHIKPYPSNHFTHAGIDAALELRSRGVTPEDVVAVELGLPAPVLRTVAEPADVKASPESGYAAAFSGPYTVAAALVGGGGLGLYIDDFTDEAARRPEVLALARKVTCYADPDCTALFPGQFPARVTAHLTEGRTEEVIRHTNRGGPHLPLTEGELRRKFTLNATRSFDGRSVELLASEIQRLADTASARSVMKLLRIPG